MHSPLNCYHQLSVSRSYMTRSELRSFPVVPKLNVRPPTRRSNATEELHNGHQVTAMGVPPTVSLTISCQIRMRRGKARASEPIRTEITGSRGARFRVSPTGTNCGRSIAGMPSFGGPPEKISL